VPGGPTQPPPAGGGPLVGPEWTVLYSGDLNGDGAPDVVAYKPASLTAGPAFQQAQYANFKGVADAIVVVQANPAGQPYVQVEGSKTLLRSAGNTLTSFTGAAGHMARVNVGRQPQLDIQAVDANGAPIGRMLGLAWDGAAGRYVIYTAPAK
jgi:hypothetical protein